MAEQERQPLFDAAMRGDVDAVERLVQEGADPHETFLEKTPLQAAARYGRIAGLKALLNVSVPTNRIEQEAENRAQAMVEAALGGHVEAAEILLEHDTTYDHKEALRAAISRGEWAMVDWLLDQYPDCGFYLNPVRPPLPTLKRLVAGGAEVLGCFGGQHLGDCSRDFERFRYLYDLDRAYFHTILDTSACSTRLSAYRPIDVALQVAAGKGALEAVRFLIEEGAQVDHPANPMLAAATGGEALISPGCLREKKGHSAVLQLLAQHGSSSDIFVQVALGEIDGFVEAIEEDRSLLEAQTEPDFGKSILHVALVHDRIDALRALLEMGADANLPDQYCDLRPLHIAVARLDVEAVDLLLQHGARPHVHTEGMFPFSPLFGLFDVVRSEALDADEQIRATNIVQKLLAHGATLNGPKKFSSAHLRILGEERTMGDWIRKHGPDWMKSWLAFEDGDT